jgi:hypothetical protein
MFKYSIEHLFELRYVVFFNKKLKFLNNILMIYLNLFKNLNVFINNYICYQKYKLNTYINKCR